jgi:hypothetical protein
MPSDAVEPGLARVPNYLDLDSDNDSIPDAIEGSADRDGDGAHPSNIVTKYLSRLEICCFCSLGRSS